jgi:lipid II isoglutaminyl synthase (glutamine-hydrolysing)
MRFLSLFVGKIIFKILRLLGRSGSALPGLVVEKLSPSFLKLMLAQLPEGVVVITGTNGKTTTTKITAALIEAQGFKVLTNKTGSNFVRGIVATVVDKATWGGKLPYDIAILEQDEAHAVHFVSQIKPRGVAILNIARDQMDRYGEIDTTAKLLQQIVGSATNWVVLNANDERVSKLTPKSGLKTIWYGHSKSLQHSFLTDDELHHGDNTTYTQASKMDVELTAFDKVSTTVSLRGEKYDLESPLVGSHNAINITAALAILNAIKPDFNKDKAIASIASLEPAFGRGEVIMLKDGTKVTLQLVKNPGGFTHALGMLDIEDYGAIAVAINDNYADGRDVSWLWDVDFNRLENNKAPVLTGGVRGHDMAVRLKYDGVEVKDVNTDLDDFVCAVNRVAKDKTAIIFCTYTAMLKIRELYKQYSDEVYKVSV